MDLAELAANEQDPKRLLELVAEINKLLAEKQDRLNSLLKDTSK
jgi:ABC-type transporter Mla subunit MlaD